MDPARAEVWWNDSSLEGGGVFLGATIWRLSTQSERVEEGVRVDVSYDGDDCGECERLVGYFYADGSLRKLEAFEGEIVPVRQPMPLCSLIAAPATTALGAAQACSATRQEINSVDGGVNVVWTVSCAKVVSWLDPEKRQSAHAVPTRRRSRRWSMVEASAPAGCEALLRQALIECEVDATAEAVIQAGSHLASLSFLLRTGNNIIGHLSGGSGSASALARFHSVQDIVACFFPFPSDMAATISRGTPCRGTEMAIPGAAL